VHPKPEATVCLCPAGDVGCPCHSSAECQGYCELVEANSNDQCVPSVGTCSETVTLLSCACVVGPYPGFGDPRGAGVICIQ